MDRAQPLTLAYLRKAQHMRQSDLAYRLGVTRHTVMRWENGDTVPSSKWVIMLARVLGVPMQVVMDAIGIEG